MIRLLFFGLGHLSRGDVTIAADVARQLDRRRFRVAFVVTSEVVTQIRDLGLAAIALDGATVDANLAIVDGAVRSFKPDMLVTADAFTLNYSVGWSGLNMRILRARYDVPLASFDQYDWRAADYVVDFYGGHRKRFPPLLESCDLLIRNVPLNRPAEPEAGVVLARLAGTGPRDGGLHPPGPRTPLAGTGRRPVVFLANSKWEYVDVNKRAGTSDMAQLIAAMPHVLHSHLAAFGRPMKIVHVGPVPWRFPTAGHLDYVHLPKLPPASFFEHLVNADVFLSTNSASVTVSHAALAGVPVLMLDNDRSLTLTGDGRTDPSLAWLVEAAPWLEVAHPFRICPWGWHRFLAPVLGDNPYTGCYARAGVFDRPAVLAALHTLLDDPTAATALLERQLDYDARLAGLPPLDDALDAAVKQIVNRAVSR